MNKSVSRHAFALVTATALLLPGRVHAAWASADRQPAGASAAQPEAEKQPFKQEELEQMLAPIALYPDSVLSQILMASTYPLEIVEADRWVKAHKDIKGDAAAKALEAEPWDPSVKSLVNFPDVLAMLSEKLPWTQNLGDAFIGQQKELMDTVQKLRAKAKGEGKLETSSEQKVTVQQEGATQVIVIEPANPDVIYVPAYNPAVVYGAWPYPAYPPYPYYPPTYHPVAGAALAFGAGVALGAAWGYAWGNCNWGHGDVNININQNINRNTNINRSNYTRNNASLQGGQGAWKHDPAHRGDVGYRDQGTAKRYGGSTASQAASARESYRGRTDQGRQNPASASAGAPRSTASPARPTQGGASERPSTGAARTPAAGSARGGALDGVNSGGAAARQESARGQASRGGGGGAARSGGGGRGGGGRR